MPPDKPLTKRGWEFTSPDADDPPYWVLQFAGTKHLAWIEGALAIINGRLAIVALHVWPVSVELETGGTRFLRSDETPLVGITADLVRRVGLSDITRAAHEALDESPESFPAWRDYTERLLASLGDADRDATSEASTSDALDADQRVAEGVAQEFPARRSRGRPNLSDDFLRSVALTWAELDGHPSPRKELAVRFVKAKLKPTEPPLDTVRDWLRVARKRGYLEQATRGARLHALGPRMTESSTSSDPTTDVTDRRSP